jgi:uncharacterized spore protein YtfJ
MDLQKYCETVQQVLADSAHVKTVFGDPVSAAGKTVIPVARVRYGFGAGMGSGPTRSGDEHPLGQGGGGGGGIDVKPIGVIEVSAEATRFVPIHSRTRIAAVALLGFSIGWLLHRR